jgi:hypothetical protein
MQAVPCLRGCALLRTLDLSFNRIASPGALLALRPCVRLQVVSLNDNAVSRLGGYRQLLAALCPALCELDNLPLDAQGAHLLPILTYADVC